MFEGFAIVAIYITILVGIPAAEYWVIAWGKFIASEHWDEWKKNRKKVANDIF